MFDVLWSKSQVVILTPCVSFKCFYSDGERRQQRRADDWGSFKIKDFKHSKYDNYKVWRSQVDEGDNRHFCLCICLKVTQSIAKETQNIIVSQPLTLGFPPNRNQSITTTRNKSKPEQNQNKTRTKLFLRLQYLVFLNSIFKYF